MDPIGLLWLASSPLGAPRPEGPIYVPAPRTGIRASVDPPGTP